MDETVLHTTALLTLNKSRIWTDCGGCKDQTERVHKFLNDLKNTVDLELACRNPNVLAIRVAPVQEPIDWDPPNHAEALLNLDLAAILTGCIKTYRERDVLIFIAQAFAMYGQLQNVGTTSGKRLRSEEVRRLLGPQQDPEKRMRRQQQPASRQKCAPRSVAKAKTHSRSRTLVDDTPHGTTQAARAVDENGSDPRGDLNARKPAALKDAPSMSRKSSTARREVQTTTARKSKTRKPTAATPLAKPVPHGKSRKASHDPAPKGPPTGPGKTSRNATGKRKVSTKEDDKMKRVLASCRHKLVKSRVAKTFDGIDYPGCVVSVDRNIDPPHEILFRVRFDDNDKEDFDATELLDALKHPAIPETDRAFSEENAKWVEVQILQPPVEWSVPGSKDAGEKFGNDMEIVAFRVRKKTSAKVAEETTMLNYLFKARVMVCEYEVKMGIAQSNEATGIEPVVNHGGSTLELVCVREVERNSCGFFEPKILKLIYVKTKQRNSETNIDLQDELLRIADFSRLPPRKVMARLELLQSPSRFNDVCFFDESQFVTIEERGNVGCGFISEDLLVQTLISCGMSVGQASRVNAIQIRIFHPSLGGFKGVLMRKRRPATEEPCIQLPPSMLKVPPSTHPNRRAKVAMIICKIGVHPSPGSSNEYIGRALDPERDAPPELTFQRKISKHLSLMVGRLMRTMGVSKDEFELYVSESRFPSRRNHAWLVGVADPTCGGLPPDTVFVTGMESSQQRRLFVTRSPCVKYEDGRVFKHVTEKPRNMTREDWEWLNGLSFGCIIFSDPRPGKISMPERTGDGDLDGDLYLVCWDSVLLEKMQPAAFPDIDSTDDGVLSLSPTNETWFSNAQELMQDINMFRKVMQLRGCLYKEAEKIADQDERCLQHPDAMALFDAFNKALQFTKHGGKIFLPATLHEKVDQSLRELLSDV